MYLKIAEKLQNMISYITSQIQRLSLRHERPNHRRRREGGQEEDPRGLLRHQPAQPRVLRIQVLLLRAAQLRQRAGTDLLHGHVPGRGVHDLRQRRRQDVGDGSPGQDGPYGQGLPKGQKNFESLAKKYKRFSFFREAAIQNPFTFFIIIILLFKDREKNTRTF